MEKSHEESLANSRRESVTSLQDFSDILDLSTLDLDNQETWLYEPQCVSSIKCINTATFTRPKRRFLRTSISDLEQIYHSGGESSNLTTCLEEKQGFNNNVPQTVKEEPETMPTQEAVMPLQFDLHQPISLHNFDSFMFSSQMSSFQNMSPPSLANYSLCSSTFSSLMENSVIKNDPILREIRDKDFMESSLLQDTDPPMFQSLSESCCISNTDTPEAFLERVSQNCTLKTSQSFTDNNATFVNQDGLNENGESKKGLNATYELGGSDVKNSTYSKDTVPPKHEATGRNVLDTTTSVRHIKPSATFRKSDLKNRVGLNVTKVGAATDNKDMERNLTQSIENDLNNSNKETVENVNPALTKPNGLVIQRRDNMELLKKRSFSDGSMDLNTPGQEKIDVPNSTFVKDDVPVDINQTPNSINRMSVGSAESLDRLSSLSSSSKSSNKMQSFEDIQDIDERFSLRRLSRVMSTPLVVKRRSLMYADGGFVSPIVANAKYPSSDSDLSDEYKSVTSQPTSNVSLESWTSPKNTTTVNNDLTKTKPTQRAVYTMPSVKPALHMPNSTPAATFNNTKTLKNTANTATGLAGSNQNLHKFAGKMESPPSTYSNLKTMSTKLKGSYTSLRPISANLPVAPPLLNGTHTVTRPGKNADSNTVKTVVKSATATHIRPSSKPDQPRASGLPRPTGIPRPTSRIPGPRSGR